MKIIVVQDTLRSGGTERQSILLSRAFRAAGHETLLLTFRPGGALASTGGPQRALQPFDLGLDWFAPGLAGAVRRFGPDAILCMGRMANCQAGRLQRKFPAAAVVATVRTGKPLPWLFRRSLRRVRHIVANSVEARERIAAAHGLRRDRITVIRNGLVFPGEAGGALGAGRPTSELRAKFGAGPETTVLLSVAMFRPEKNQRELVEIVAELPPGLGWQLWLAGDGPERAACARLVERRGLGARVKFPGFFADPGPLYAAADAAVHASRSEALSNFLIESQAHGLLAVAREAQGIRECFLPGRTGWIAAPGDRAGFRTALAGLIALPAAARAARGAEARTFARANFDPGRQAFAYLELFARLIRG